MECLRRWDRNGTMFLDHLAINVSSRQFSSADFVRDTIRDLVSIGVPPQSVVIEVTEGTVIENFTETALKMEQLRDIGIRFSVDDFGIGYSSLSYLSRLPLDQLKIDRLLLTSSTMLMAPSLPRRSLVWGAICICRLLQKASRPKPNWISWPSEAATDFKDFSSHQPSRNPNSWRWTAPGNGESRFPERRIGRTSRGPIECLRLRRPVH
jgi:hypothetical protein